MKLWHKDLIPVLPSKQLLSQWRELNCIARNVKINGMPNHLLVNKVSNYDKSHFIAYTKLVLKELENKNYHIRQNTFHKFLQYIETSETDFKNTNIEFFEIYKDWHNNRYFFSVTTIFKKNTIVEASMKKNGKELIVKNFNIISVFAKDMLCKNSKKVCL